MKHKHFHYSSSVHSGKSLIFRFLPSLLAIVLLFTFAIPISAAKSGGFRYANTELYPGGIPFGVKFVTDGVIVVGFSDVTSDGQTTNPAADAGIRLRDIITEVNGKAIDSAKDLTRAIEECNGKPLSITCRRGANSKCFSLTPVYSTSESRYKTGIWVRDSGAGIGTVTFIVPSDNAFAGLGHGICDGETGELIPMKRGTVTGVTISGVERGAPGSPGEIKGYFTAGKTGAIVDNTVCGVYGIYTTLPQSMTSEKLHVASKSEIKEGAATILCSLDTGDIKEYGVNISAINLSATGPKCFYVHVTDKALIEKSGGIIQGMSGSPIIQNGKLIGAVTHVLISDPLTGYGIFIENMLDAMPGVLK